MTFSAQIFFLTTLVLSFFHSALAKNKEEKPMPLQHLPCVQHTPYDDFINYPIKKGELPPPPPEKKCHEMILCYRKAAENGDLRAQVMLGFAYLDGNGVPKDREVAKTWFKKACINGYKKSCDFYQNLTDGYW